MKVLGLFLVLAMALILLLAVCNKGDAKKNVVHTHGGEIATSLAHVEDDGASTSGQLQPQTACPVMGGTINQALYVEHAGKRIYVCCPPCLAKVKQDPAKYIQVLEAQGVALEKAQEEVR